MSQWTYVRGCLELDSISHEFKHNKRNSKNAYLPFPDEQMKINPPTVFHGEKESFLQFAVSIYSLPRARKYIEEAFEFLPSGEHLVLSHAISQSDSNCWSSSSDFHFECDRKEFEKKILNMYEKKVRYIEEEKRLKHLKSILNFEPYLVKDVSGIIVGIRDDIRYCSGEELLEGFEKFFTHLHENNIDIIDGYLEWEDSYQHFSDNPYYYCWRYSTLSSSIDEYFSFYRIDKKTNKILWKKTYMRPYKIVISEDGKEEKHFDCDSKEFIIEEYNYEEN